MATDDYTPEIRTKTCTKCANAFPATTEFFFGNSRGGLLPTCKTCHIQSTTAWKKAHPDQDREIQRRAREKKGESIGKPIGPRRLWIPLRDDGQRECTVCHKLLPETTDYFYASSTAKKGLSAQCKKCISDKERLKHTTHRDMPALRHDGLRECSKCHRLLPEHQEFFTPHMRSARGLLRHCRDCQDIPKQAWKANNKEKFLVYDHRRRARRQNKPDTFTPEQWLFALEYWHYGCAVCGQKEGFWWKLEADHWIPLSDEQSPGTVATNIVPLCGGITGCNQNKHATEPQKWLILRLGPIKARRKLKEILTFFTIVAQREPEGDKRL
jgi:hypothetical protein